MKKLKLLLIIGAVISGFLGFGQDDSYFVKADGDTITCEITRITSDFLFYKVGETRSRVELSQIIFYNKQDDVKGSVPKDADPLKIERANKELIRDYQDEVPHERVRIISNAGIGYRIGRAPAFIPKDYMRQLRLGSDFDIRLQVFERDNGLALEYNQFSSLSEGNIPRLGYVIEDILIRYYGLSWILRKMEENGNIGYISFGLGALFYESNGFIDGQEQMMSGATLGLRMNYDYSIAINKFISVGLNFGLLLGTLTQIEINGSPYTAQHPDEGENISRVNLGAGIRFGI